MKRTYITVVPLQGKKDLEAHEYESVLTEHPIETRFPIVQVLHSTMEPGDNVKVIAFRFANGDTERNFALLKQELAAQGIGEEQITDISSAETQDSKTLLKVCKRIVDEIPDFSMVYACITYGTKPTTIILESALRIAEKIRSKIEIAGVWYGELQRNDAVTVGAKMYDVSVLHSLSSIIGDMDSIAGAEWMLRNLVDMDENE